MDVRLPNGKIIRGVPEGTPKEVIMQKAIASGLATEQDFNPVASFAEQPTQQQVQQSSQEQELAKLAAKQGPLDTLAISMGRGLYNIGRGAKELVGMDVERDPLEEMGYQKLQEERPITTAVGQGIGEALPALPLATAATPLAFAPRVAAMTGLGATEAGLASLGRGDENALSQAGYGGAIAGTFEAVLPVFGRIVGNVYRNLTGKTVSEVLDQSGNVLPEVKGTLESMGVNVEELKSQAVSLVESAPKNADEAARLARFKEQGIPYTPGDISGEFAQRAKEARLLEVQGSAADPLRNIRTTQAKQIDELKTALSDSLGVPDQQTIGEFVKLGLGEAENIARKDRKALYDLLAEKAGYQGGIPLPKEKIIDTIFNDNDFLGMVNALKDSEMSQLNKMMVKYGIDDTPEAVEAFTSKIEPGILGKSSAITNLTTKNAEDFNKALNSMVGQDSSAALKGVVGKLKSAVDGGFDMIDDAISPELMALKQEARKSHQALMRDFSPQSMAGRLTNVKQDGITPIVEASNVFNQLFKTGRTNTIEPLSKVMAQLEKTDAGKRAIGDMQSKLILDVMDKGFSPSDVINGQMMFSGNRAEKYLKSLGEAEVEQLFKNNPKALKSFKDLIQTGIDITPSSKETVKGSGSVMINTLNTIADITLANKLGPVQGLFTAAKKISQAGADEKELAKLYKMNPQLKTRAEFIERELPSMAVLLGITQIKGEEDAENN